MNILLSYCGLLDATISASEKDLPLNPFLITTLSQNWNDFSTLSLNFFDKLGKQPVPLLRHSLQSFCHHWTCLDMFKHVSYLIFKCLTTFLEAFPCFHFDSPTPTECLSSLLNVKLAVHCGLKHRNVFQCTWTLPFNINV